MTVWRKSWTGSCSRHQRRLRQWSRQIRMGSQWNRQSGIGQLRQRRGWRNFHQQLGPKIEMDIKCILLKLNTLRAAVRRATATVASSALAFFTALATDLTSLKTIYFFFYCIPYLPDLGMFSKEDNSDQTSIRAVGIDGFCSLNSGLLGKLSEKLQEI